VENKQLWQLGNSWPFADILPISEVAKSDNLEHRQSLSLPLQLAGQRATKTALVAGQFREAWQAPYFHITLARPISKCKSVAKAGKTKEI